MSDISGLPMLEVTASGDVQIGEFARYIGIGSGIPEYDLDVSASGRIQKGLVLTDYVPATTTNALYNDGGTLKFNGSAVAGSAYDDTYVSGVAAYASGQAIENETEIASVSGWAATHPTISAASSSDNSGRTYIQDITLDSNGHVTGLTTATETVTDTNTTYTAGSGLVLEGTEFNIHSGSGNFKEVIFGSGRRFNDYDYFGSQGVQVGGIRITNDTGCDIGIGSDFDNDLYRNTINNDSIRIGHGIASGAWACHDDISIGAGIGTSAYAWSKNISIGRGIWQYSSGCYFNTAFSAAGGGAAFGDLGKNAINCNSNLAFGERALYEAVDCSDNFVWSTQDALYQASGCLGNICWDLLMLGMMLLI